jgi:hypothetical protein
MNTSSVFSTLKPGAIQGAFPPNQVTALTDWSRGIHQRPPGAFVAELAAGYDLATGWNFVTPKAVLFDEAGNWDPQNGWFQCGPGQLWQLTAYVRSDDETIPDGQLQACAWVDAGAPLPTSSTAGFNLFKIGLTQAYAGNTSTGLVGGSAPYFFREFSQLKIMARFSGTVAVTVLPGQGKTYAAGFRIA